MALPKDGSTYYIINVKTKTALSSVDTGKSDDKEITAIKGWEWCIGEGEYKNTAQQWKVKYTEKAHDGRQYVTLQNVSSDNFLDIGDVPVKNGVPIVAKHERTKYFTQEWSFIPMGSNAGDSNLQTYRICNYHSYNRDNGGHMYNISLSNGSNTNGTQIHSWDVLHNNTEQIWAFVATSPS